MAKKTDSLSLKELDCPYCKHPIDYSKLKALINKERAEARIEELERLLPQMNVGEYSVWIRVEISDRLNQLRRNKDE